jgi:acyl-CoA thioester hydrolase
MKHKLLSIKTETIIRFSEVDSMGVVWHGNYVKYFEDGREAFGNKYGLNYLDFHKNGILTPIVKLSCNRDKYSGIFEYEQGTYVNNSAFLCRMEKKVGIY